MPPEMTRFRYTKRFLITTLCVSWFPNHSFTNNYHNDTAKRTIEYTITERAALLLVHIYIYVHIHMYIDDGVTLSFYSSRIVHYSHEELCRSIQLQTGTTFPVGTKASSESNVILLQRSVHRSVTLLPIRA